MLYKTGRADGSHTNKGVNMKEYKIDRITYSSIYIKANSRKEADDMIEEYNQGTVTTAPKSKE